MYQYHRRVSYLPLHSNLMVFVGMEIIMKKIAKIIYDIMIGSNTP